MHKAEFVEFLNEEWSQVPCLRVGSSTVDCPPCVCVGILKNSVPDLRLDIYTKQECQAFQEIRCTEHVLVIGYGEHIYVMNLDNYLIEAIKLPDYFGHIYTPEDLQPFTECFDFLVASGSSLWRLDAAGNVLWKAEDIAIDGVTVHKVENGIVTGSAEWDPPGGWRKFQVSLISGETI